MSIKAILFIFVGLCLLAQPALAVEDFAKSRFREGSIFMLSDLEDINWVDIFIRDDLIVGWPDPNETLYVHDTTWWHFGNIYIVNHGVMLIQGAEFRNYGNIWLFNYGKFHADSSEIGFLPFYWWQFSFGGKDSSEILLSNSYFCFSLPILIGGFNDCHISLINMQSDAWKSGYFYDNAGLTIDNCHGLTGEYCMMDSATGSISVTNSDTIAIWLSFFNGSVADFSTFYEEFVEHWQFPEDAGATGIPYSVTIDSSFIWNTSVMLYKGSDVTLRNSYTTVRIRATRTDSLVIVGLMDSTYYANWEFPFSDRYLHLINTTAWKYSIYAVDSSKVWLDSSRVSEIVCMKNSSLNMKNSIHNGRAGCFWIWDSSTADVMNSLIQSETVVRGSSRLTFYNSFIEDNIMGSSNLIVEDRGAVVLLNSRIPHEPLLYNSSVLYFASIDSPTVAPQADSVPIYGSAYIDGGPDCNISFSSYRLYFADSSNPDSLIPIAPEHTNEVRDSLLDYWNTYSLAQGNYTLYMRMKDNLGDSVQTFLPVQVS
ncbi:hypothetical protein KAU34_04340, partial [candidate division WOR-3 bacterium]|nr:hypothetical protein [candidate division WOR-3 bacterium]